MLLFHELFVILAFADFLKDITIVSELHNDAERARRLIKECMFIGCDEGILDRCEDTNFVQGVFLFPIGQVLYLDFLEGIDLVIFDPFNLIDA